MSRSALRSLPLLASLALLAACQDTPVTPASVAPEPRSSTAGGSADNVVLSILARWWSLSIVDHLTSNDQDETHAGYVFDGQTFYVPRDPMPGTQPLYRLFNGRDHMESNIDGEGGYTTEWRLGLPYMGHPYTTQQPGTCEIRRWFYPARGNHLTAHCGENPTSGGYQPEGVLGYGYPRYGTQMEPGLEVEGQQIRVVANRAAGGAISELWWGGKQFINNHDYGRQIQISVWPRWANGDNPNEAGDRYGWRPGQDSASQWGHGSPLLSAGVNGHTLTTTTLPLQWTPETFGGGPKNPVLWRGTISKEITLMDSEGYPNVLRWTSKATLPSDLPNGVGLEAPTAYLTSDFNRFYAYTPATDYLQDVTSFVDQGVVIDGGTCAGLSGNAEPIIATADGAYALGLYRRKQPNENIDSVLCRWTLTGNGGKYGADTSKWSYHYNQFGYVPAGELSVTTYIVAGTLAQVRAEARRLHLANY